MDSRIFDWLDCDLNELPYYLRLLNLVWSDAGAADDLKRCAAVAQRLHADPAYWSQLIRAASWRHTLVGCVCVILLRPADRFEDLLDRFIRGSFVSPQVCMTMGLVYPANTLKFFPALLDNKPRTLHAKEGISAYRVLDKLGQPRLPLWQIIKNWQWFIHPDAKTAKHVINAQWDFWASHSGRAEYNA